MMDGYEHPAVAHIREEMRKLPELPPGWVYEFSYDEVYNHEVKGWEYRIVAKPVQKYAIEK